LAPDYRLGYVPIYGNSGVGRPGTDGSAIHVIDLRAGRTVNIINLTKPVRPHCAKFGPDGLLYVSAELSNAIFALDPASGKLVAEILPAPLSPHVRALARRQASLYL
jgi:DNA-binding beta-propeller fold protein YncE